jgi:hypothetical protein
MARVGHRILRARVITVAIGLAVAGLAFAGAVFASTTGWRVQPSPKVSGDLVAVAASSSTNAWAVGSASNGALIEHWNGTAWRIQKSPDLTARLAGVSATSPTNAWAVGSYNGKNLIEHWNGRAWRVRRSPTPPGAVLYGVDATSRTNAWAVGWYTKRHFRTLIEHWNGTSWNVQKSPNDTKNGLVDNQLFAVAATSSNNAWAVGFSDFDAGPGGPFPGLIEHWNGTAWKIQKSPSGWPLTGVAATSRTNAWAVPSFGHIVHWNGNSWKVQKSPKLNGATFPDPANPPTAVTATSSTNAWATSPCCKSGKIVHWNGKTWRIQKSPNLNAIPFDVAATSRTNAWAVGSSGNPNFQTLIERWNGKG